MIESNVQKIKLMKSRIHDKLILGENLDQLDILKNLYYFRIYSQDIRYTQNFYQILQNMQSIQVKEGQVIYHKGQHGSDIYFIVSGKVRVFIPKKELDLQLELNLSEELENAYLQQTQLVKKGQLDKEQEKLNKQIISQLEKDHKEMNSHFDDNDKIILKQLPITQQLQYFIGETCTYRGLLDIGPNGHFGDSVMLGQELRNQTIIALQDTNLLYINGKDFKKIFENKYTFIENCLKKFFGYKKVYGIDQKQQLSQILIYFEETIYKQGDIIFDQGDFPDYLYLVKQGSVKLIQIQTPNQFQSSQQGIQGMQQNNQNGTIQNNQDAINLGYVEQGDFFGFEDLFFSQARSFRVQVNQEMTITYKIHKFLLENLLEDNQLIIQISRLGRNRLNEFQEKMTVQIKQIKNEQNEKVHLSTFYGIKPTLKQKKIIGQMDLKRKNLIIKEIRDKQRKKEMNYSVIENGQKEEFQQEQKVDEMEKNQSKVFLGQSISDLKLNQNNLSPEKEILHYESSQKLEFGLNQTSNLFLRKNTPLVMLKKNLKQRKSTINTSDGKLKKSNFYLSLETENSVLNIQKLGVKQKKLELDEQNSSENKIQKILDGQSQQEQIYQQEYQEEKKKRSKMFNQKLNLDNCRIMENLNCRQKSDNMNQIWNQQYKENFKFSRSHSPQPIKNQNPANNFNPNNINFPTLITPYSVDEKSYLKPNQLKMLQNKIKRQIDEKKEEEIMRKEALEKNLNLQIDNKFYSTKNNTFYNLTNQVIEQFYKATNKENSEHQQNLSSTQYKIKIPLTRKKIYSNLNRNKQRAVSVLERNNPNLNNASFNQNLNQQQQLKPFKTIQNSATPENNFQFMKITPLQFVDYNENFKNKTLEERQHLHSVFEKLYKKNQQLNSRQINQFNPQVQNQIINIKEQIKELMKQIFQNDLMETDNQENLQNSQKQENFPNNLNNQTTI